MNCPICGKEAKTARGLTKHLTGGVKYGGHEMDAHEAIEKVALAAKVAPPSRTPSTEEVKAAVQEPGMVPEKKAGFLYAALARVVDNKDLPKYQFERVIDAFLGSFLPGIVSDLDGGSVELVAQEFPLKKPGSYQSTNMDYVLFRGDEDGRPGAWIFLELKTDPRSVREVQDEIYERVLGPGTAMDSLIDNVREISEHSSQAAKYQELLGRFEGFPLDRSIEVMYLAPDRHDLPGYQGRYRSISFGDLEQVEIEDYAGEWGVFKELVLPLFP